MLEASLHLLARPSEISATHAAATQRCHQQRDTFPLRIGTHPLLPDGVVRPNASILGGGVLQRFTIRYQSSRHSR
ncbi:hypothetical protein VDGE_30106 [Verticillium dahliae]|uniref:Uncharacterized protein n=1 Tax=Verticillium dahliae TaxID=27337 RepID=A0A444S4K4_VERDA|nr:hypothetical protein VDGE_30106 [Verticillium dahliae]